MPSNVVEVLIGEYILRPLPCPSSFFRLFIELGLRALPIPDVLQALLVWT